MRTPDYLLTRPSSRAVDGIQENIIKRGRRNVICRLYYAKDDKKAIATWGLDLNEVLRVFNVRSVISVWPLLIVRFQNELRMATLATGSDARQDAANKHAVVSDTHCDVTNVETIASDVQSYGPNTHTAASDIHRTKLKSRGGADGQNRAVSTTGTLSPSKYLPLPSPTPGQRSRLQLNPVFNFCIQRTRRVTVCSTGKYPWSYSQYPARYNFGGSARYCEDSNHGFRHSWDDEKSARGWWPTSVSECHRYPACR